MVTYIVLEPEYLELLGQDETPEAAKEVVEDAGTYLLLGISSEPGPSLFYVESFTVVE